MLARVLRSAGPPQSSKLLQPSLTRAFHASTKTQALSETDSRDSKDKKAEIESQKQDNLQKKGKGEWNPELASSSEAAVKADRQEIKASEKNIKEMQKEGEKMANKK